MFDFLFGGKRKLELIRELIVRRAIHDGLSNIEARVNVKSLGNMSLMGSPEGTIVSIVEILKKLKSNGDSIHGSLDAIERVRKQTGYDPSTFDYIKSLARQGNDYEFIIATYCRYRIDIEHSNAHISDEHLFMCVSHSLKLFP